MMAPGGLRERRHGTAQKAAAILLLGVVVDLLGGCSDPIPSVPPDGGGSTASNGGAGGAGGVGGAAGCTTADACPGADAPCRTRSCLAGTCGFVLVPQGDATAQQVPQDCRITVCDGQGEVLSLDYPQDILDDGNPCTEDVCDDGGPLNLDLPAGTQCDTGSGTLCDGMGQCVECLQPDDCTSKVCQLNACIPATCADGVANGAETDIDCGGIECNPCGDLLVCNVANDCTSKICNANVCAVPTCQDGVQNGDETDDDCGGGCEPCATGQGCGIDADCVGGSCSGSVCLPTCTDGAQNANETDIDCGGAVCGPCQAGQICASGSDCSSTICESGFCTSATCSDGAINGSESDLDCGGSCDPCAEGLTCTIGFDCQSGVCLGTCQPPSCSDGVTNGSETDHDCGGSCPPCATGQVCLQGSDCQEGLCLSNLCAPVSCGDGYIGGAEACDDGGAVGGDGCSALCSIEPGHTCAGTPSSCTPICGDGLVVGGEPCDDGNLVGSDGCAAGCTLEAGYTCSGAPSICAAICGDGLTRGLEQCDDGNVAVGDCCSASCAVESGCEIEPNNTVAEALVSPQLTQSGAVSGSISSIGDVDVFAVNVTDVVDLRIQTFQGYTTGSCTSADTQVELVAPDGTSVLASNDNGGLVPCSLVDPNTNAAARGLAPGIYFVRVRESGNNALIPAYHLAFTAAAVCGNGTKEGSEQCDDANILSSDGCSSVCKLEPQQETESNNSCATANGPFTMPIPNGSFIGGTITPVGDSDWFSFTLTQRSDMRIETFDSSGPGSCSSTDTEMQLFMSDCVTSVGPAQNGGGLGACAKLDPATNTQVRQLQPGTYYLRVNESGNDATLSGYTLQASLLSRCGNNVVEGFERCDGTPLCDVTCNRVQSCGDGFIDFPESCDDGNLAAGDGCGAGCATESGYICGSFGGACLPICGDNTLTNNEACDDGNTTNGDGCDVSCSVESSPPGGEVEPNGTLAEAEARALDSTPIIISGVSTMMTGAISPVGDKDTFKMTLAAASVVRMETFDPTGAACSGGMTTIVRMYDAAMTQIGTDSASGISSCSALVMYLPAGTYYVQVEEVGNNSVIAGYTLQVKTHAGRDAESEPNENQVHADPFVGSDVFIIGDHQVNTDADFFAITVPSGRSLRAEVIEGAAETCESFGIDSRLTLYNYSGTQIADDDDDGRGNCSLIDGTGGAAAQDSGARNLGGGTYFLQVRASAAQSAQTGQSGQFNYRLAVSLR